MKILNWLLLIVPVLLFADGYSQQLPPTPQRVRTLGSADTLVTMVNDTIWKGYVNAAGDSTWWVAGLNSKLVIDGGSDSGTGKFSYLYLGDAINEYPVRLRANTTGDTTFEYSLDKGVSWINFEGVGDITAVLAGANITVTSGASGDATVSLTANSLDSTDVVNGGLLPGSDFAQQGATTNQALVWNGTRWAPGAVLGPGTSDSTYINDGIQYGPFTNDMFKIRESTGLNITRNDSITYDVFWFATTLGTNIEDGEVDNTITIDAGAIVTIDASDAVDGGAITNSTLDPDDFISDAVDDNRVDSNSCAPIVHKAERDASGNIITTTYAPIASPNFTGTLTADSAQFDGNVDVDSMDINGVLDVTGNITVGGTVDGVDIAALNTDVAADSGSWNKVADEYAAADDSDLAAIGDTINARMAKAITGNTETGIAVTYNAADSTFDFVVDDSMMGAAEVSTVYAPIASPTFTGIVTAGEGVYVKNGAASPGFADFYEKSGNGTNYVRLTLNDSNFTTNYTLKLPGANAWLLAGPGSNGFVARTGDGISAARTLTGTSFEINISNTTGAGNPVFSFLHSAIPSSDPSMAANAAAFGVNGICFEGATADVNEMLMVPATLSGDVTITIPATTGTIALTSNLTSYLPLAGNTMTGKAVGDWYRSDTTVATNRLSTIAEVSSMINDSGLNLSGELSVKGGIYVSNLTYKLDYTNVWAQGADSIVRDIPIVYTDTSLWLAGESDTISVVHLDVARHDLGWFGSSWKNIVVFTPYPHLNNTGNENIELAYFNDDFHWTNVFDSTTGDSVINPIFEKSDWTGCDYTNDPAVYPDEDGNPRVVFNLMYADDSSVMKSTHSANGYDWGDTSMAITIWNEPHRENMEFRPTLALDGYTYFDSLVITNNVTYDTIELVSWTAPVSATTIAMICDSMVKYVNLSACSLYATAVDQDSLWTLVANNGIGIVRIDELSADTNTDIYTQTRTFMMSPSPKYLYGKYHIFGVNKWGSDSTRTMHLISNYADSGWSVKDSICDGLQPHDSVQGSVGQYVYHIKVDANPGELFCFANIKSGSANPKSIFGVSYDTGATWTMRDTTGSKYSVVHADSSGPDSVGIYRGSGYGVLDGDEWYYRYFYPAQDYWYGTPRARWNICVTNVHFYNNKETKDALIVSPDLLTDTMSYLTVDANKYPYGIRIDELSCLTSVDGAYALKFMSFTSADPPVFHDWIDTLNVGASDQRVSSITFENQDASTLDAGQELYILTPATDIDWVKVKIRFHAKEKTW